MRFSNRTQWDLAATPWARQLAQMRASGIDLYDLTASNPTHCGFGYEGAAILAALSDPRALDYDPDPRGLLSARQAVCEYYREHGAQVDPAHIILTTGTSEAYSFLFRLLSDPGDEVLIAQPSYPLFEFLAQIEDVRLVPYDLFYDYGWHIDLHALTRRIGPRTRAIALVHPNNPTGHFTSPRERTALREICREHGLALVVDEVFLDYPWVYDLWVDDRPVDGRLGADRPVGDHGLRDPQPGRIPPSGARPLDPAIREAGSSASFALGPHPVLTFVLSGVSKIAGLPQMKAAWIAAFGPREDLDPALERLDVIADTFLSMNAPVQYALPLWLRQRVLIEQQIARRVRDNLAVLDARLSGQGMVRRLEAEAGWYAILKIPALGDDEETVLRLLTGLRTIVHPGFFFGFPRAGWLVVSLLAQREQFDRGIDAILAFCRARSEESRE